MNKLIVQDNGIIVVDPTDSFKAEDVVQIDSIRRAMNVSQATDVSKASVMVFQIGQIQETIGSIDRTDLFLAQGFDQTVLMCFPTCRDSTRPLACGE